MKNQLALSYAFVMGLLIGLASVVLFAGNAAQAHDASECVCVCEPCPEMQCPDEGFSFPLPKLSGDNDGDGILDVKDAPMPDQDAIQKALDLIEKAEEKMEERKEE